MQQTLPSSWVDSLFTRLQVRYGDAWTRKWEGIDMAVVKADWAEELGGFCQNPDAIKRALELLPVHWPPTVAEFKALCIGREGDIEQEQKLLAAPLNREFAKEVLSKIERAKSPVAPKQWAENLRKREQLIDRSLSIAQRAAWRVALQDVPDAPQLGMTFKPIDNDCLPPGMRGGSS